MNFADRLKQLPSAAHLTSLQVLGADGAVLATLENKPGQAGSLALYAALPLLVLSRVRVVQRPWLRASAVRLGTGLLQATRATRLR